MRKIKFNCAKFAAICVLTILSGFCLSYVAAGCIASAYAEPTEQYEPSAPIDGMYFSTEYVVEEYEDWDLYMVRYTDADANLEECEICLTSSSYKEVLNQVATQNHKSGTLEYIATVHGVKVYSVNWE